MDFPDDSVTQNSPYTVNRRSNDRNSVKIVFGFPVDQNQFNVLKDDQSAKFQRSTQNDVGLVNPRTTRYLRIAANRADDRGS